MQIFETFKCSGQNSLNSSCQFSNDKPISLQIFHHSSVSLHITPKWIFNSCIFYFEQKDLIKVPILVSSSALVKICEIPRAIFQTTSQFFFQILHNCSVLWKITPLYFFRSNVIYQEIRKIFVLYKPCSIEWNISHAKILKVGDKHARVIWNTCSKLSIGREKHRHIFSLWTTFNNPLGVLIDNFKRIYRFGSFIIFFIVILNQP